MGITFLGDVWPVYPSGFPSAGHFVFNTAGNDDFLSAGGNEVDVAGVSSSSPQGVTGGLAWNHYDIWRFWDMSRDVTVGRTGYGRLVLNAGYRLAPQHLTVGEQAGSVGHVVLTGEGTSFSNTRENIPSAVKTANEAGSETIGSDYAAFISRAQANTYSDIGARTSGSSYTRSQRPKGSYNVTAGKAGYGAIDVLVGSLVEIEHQLLIGGEYVSSTWTNRVGGRLRLEGSALTVYGKAYADAEAAATDAPAAINGEKGVIELTGSVFRVARGLTNLGTIIVKASAAPTVIYGDLANEGTLCVESGATLIYAGTFANTGTILRGKCPNAIVGIPDVPDVYPDGTVIAVA